MKKLICNFFLNDKVILIFIVINAGIIFLQESGYSHSWLLYTDIVITFIFLVEMIIKHLSFGFKNYWKDVWNRLDGVLVIISLPSLFEIFFTTGLNLSFVLALRVFRVFKFFRIIKFLPNIKELSKGLKKALKDSYAVFLSFIIIIFIFAF
ncbi:MAG: ion transporter [Bacteroidales bacterium]|nr:ion transporter [Bacteroidales bacterium]